MIKQNDIPDEGLKMNKKLPFTVPENYFEELPLRLQERMDEGPAFTRMIELVRPRLAYAAMIIVLIAVGYLGIKIIANNSSVNGLTADEIADAIEYYAYDFDDEMLISTIVESDMELFTEETDEETEQFIEYLSEDYIDFTDIMIDY